MNEDSFIKKALKISASACPFCGWDYAEHAWNEFGEEYWICDNCGASSGTVDSKWNWQSRPIEDALVRRIVELEIELEKYNWLPTASDSQIPGTVVGTDCSARLSEISK
jgi:hypothetical protein